MSGPGCGLVLVVSVCLSLDAGTGCLVEAVAYGSERKPTVLGKPHLPMLNAIRERLEKREGLLVMVVSLILSCYSIDLSPARTLMIGDRLVRTLLLCVQVGFPRLALFRLNTDIVFGRQNGLQTLLVMSGVTEQNGLMTAPQDQIPDYYSQSIADILVCSPDKN